MTHLARICAAALIVVLPICSAQTAPHHKQKPAPKPEPTAQELFEYVRGKLLLFSPDDGINDNLEVTIDPTATVLTTVQPSGHCDQFLNALDANNLSWDIYDASDSHHSREALARLTITSLSGKTARACYDKHGQPEVGAVANRVRFLFSLEKVEQVPDFQENMSKAVKKLIALSGGLPEKAIF